MNPTALVVLSSISTLTGTGTDHESDCRVDIQICDNISNCCHIKLDDPNKDDREKGQIDTFHGYALLGACSTVGMI
jgi:hypothetical protein